MNDTTRLSPGKNISGILALLWKLKLMELEDAQITFGKALRYWRNNDKIK